MEPVESATATRPRLMQLVSANPMSAAELFALAEWSRPAGDDRSQRFRYDAAETNIKRRNAPIESRSEDRILDVGRRALLKANANDIARNFSIASWMIRRHLDYVCHFEFHSRTGDKAFDDLVEEKLRRWSRPYNCDAAGRHRFSKMIRLAEVRRVLDGDVGLLKLADGRLQGIESDRIRQPNADAVSAFNPLEWTHGVKTDAAGRALAYAIWKRSFSGWEFERFIPANRLCVLGYFDRFDQIRGVSPLASALNPLRDIYENFDYALTKAKVSNILALIVMSKTADGLGEHTYTPTATANASDPDEDDDSADENRQDKYTVNLGGGPIKLELDDGDDAKIVESEHPSNQFQNFSTLMLQVALKALDIPFSFYDESHTNFFGSRAAWLHYDRSCKEKRDDILDLLVRLTLWRLMLWIIDGELELPAGMTIGDIDFEWVPIGMPWWDPAKEIRGDLMAIGAGLDNPQRITKERGRGDWKDNVDQLGEAIAYAREKGVRLSFDAGPDPLEIDGKPGDDK